MAEVQRRPGRPMPPPGRGPPPPPPARPVAPRLEPVDREKVFDVSLFTFVFFGNVFVLVYASIRGAVIKIWLIVRFQFLSLSHNFSEMRV